MIHPHRSQDRRLFWGSIIGKSCKRLDIQFQISSTCSRVVQWARVVRSAWFSKYEMTGRVERCEATECDGTDDAGALTGRAWAREPAVDSARNQHPLAAPYYPF